MNHTANSVLIWRTSATVGVLRENFQIQRSTKFHIHQTVKMELNMCFVSTEHEFSCLVAFVHRNRLKYRLIGMLHCIFSLNTNRSKTNIFRGIHARAL